MLLRTGVPAAYGELWVEPDEDEAELAHLIVDPVRESAEDEPRFNAPQPTAYQWTRLSQI